HGDDFAVLLAFRLGGQRGSGGEGGLICLGPVGAGAGGIAARAARVVAAGRAAGTIAAGGVGVRRLVPCARAGGIVGAAGGRFGAAVLRLRTPLLGCTARVPA